MINQLNLFEINVNSNNNEKLTLQEKINIMLSEIRIDNKGNWIVPNRKRFNLTISEFVEFERQRIMEYETKKDTKYKYHYEGEEDD